MKRVIIVEDETAAVVNLRSMLASVAGEVEVVAVLESVEEAVEYLSPHSGRYETSRHLQGVYP